MAGAAVVVAGALTLALDGEGSGHPNMLAGSGDAPTNTVFIQPSVAAMTMGATATACAAGVDACDDRSRPTCQGAGY